MTFAGVMMRHLWITMFSILCCLSQAAMGQDIFQTLDPATTELELATAGRGHGINALGGHLFVRVINQSRNVDLVMQWGLFDLSDPDFVYSYINGDMKFRSGVTASDRQFEYYRQVENRSVWTVPLNLTTQQKAHLLKKFSWWMQPENRTYQYNLWYNNCATAVRDLLHEALGPKFKEHYQVPLGETFRTLGEEYFLNYPAIPYFADTFFNSSIDQPLQKWDAWLLPVMAQDLLADVPAFDDQGEPVPGQMLLGERVTVHQGVVITRPLIRNGWAIPAFFLILIGIGYRLRHNGWGRRIAGFSFMAYGCLATVVASLLAAAWGLSGHEVTHANANLWFYWPMDFLFIGVGAVWVFGRQWPLGERSCWYLSLGHLVLLGLGAGLWAIGIIEQDISVTLKYWLPATVATTVGLRTWQQVRTAGLGDQDIHSRKQKKGKKLRSAS